MELIVEPLLIPRLYSWEFGKSDYLSLCWATDTSRLQFQAQKSAAAVLQLGK